MLFRSFCLMYLRPMLGLGARCKLEEACKQHGVDRAVSHIASADAMASADLFLRYLAEIDAQGIVTFGDLARLRKYKFVESFDLAPLPAESTFGLQRFSTNASRAASAAAQPPTLTPAAAYWDLLKSVLVDLEVTDQEVAAIESEKDRSGISPEEVRVLHARAFTSVISQFAADKLINDREQGRLRRLYECLTRLGWAPGQ